MANFRRLLSICVFASSCFAPAWAQNAQAPFFNVADPTDPYVIAEATALNNDPNQIFAFVRDQVKFQAYAGSVRGSRGALWTMAGNSLDKSSLLVALLRAAGYTAQYAQGTLDYTHQNTLSALTAPSGVQVLGCPPSPSTGYGFQTDIQTHFWVEYGSANTDLDPSFPGDTPGQTNTTVTTTFTDVPQQYRQTITVKENVETYSQASVLDPFSGSPLSTTTVLQSIFETAALVGHPLSLIHRTSQNVIGALVYTYQTFSYTPLLVVGSGGTNVSVDPVVNGTTFQEVYTNYPLSSSLVTGVFLEIDAPDNTGTVQTYTRTLFDRIGYANRQSNTPVTVSTPATPTAAIDPNTVVTINALAGSQSKLAFTNQNTRIQTALTAAQALEPQITPLLNLTSYTPAQQALIQQGIADNTYVSISVDETATMAYFLTSDIVEANLQSAYYTAEYYNSPRITLAITTLNSTGTGLTTSLDLIKRDVRSVIGNGNNSQAGFYLENMRGLWESALEGPVLAEVTGTAPVDATAVFNALLAAGGTGVILDQNNADQVSSYGWSANAQARITTALTNGEIVLAPNQEVTVNGSPTLMWFQFNPNTGETISVGEDGGHQALATWALTELGVLNNEQIAYRYFGVVEGFGIGAAGFAAAVIDAVAASETNPIQAAKNSLKGSAKGSPTSPNFLKLFNVIFKDKILPKLKFLVPLQPNSFTSNAEAGIQIGISIASNILPALLGADPSVVPILSQPISGAPNPVAPGTTPGVEVTMVPDPVFSTLTYGNEELPLVYLLSVQNTGAVTDTFSFYNANYLPGFTPTPGIQSLTIPAGQTGQLDVCVNPSSSQPAAPGTSENLGIQIYSQNGGNQIAVASTTFSAPTFNSLAIGTLPGSLVIQAGKSATTSLSLSASGNADAGQVALSVSTPAGVSVTGLATPVYVAAGQVVNQPLQVSVASGTSQVSSVPLLFTATYSGGQTATYSMPFQVGGVSTCTAQASLLSTDVQQTALSSTLNLMAADMISLAAAPTNTNLQSRVAGDVTTVLSEITSSPYLMQYQSQLTAVIPNLTSSSSSTVLSALASLDSVFCTVNNTLQAAENTGFQASLSNSSVVMSVGGQAYNNSVSIYNQSGVSRAFNIAVSNVPNGVTVAVTPSVVVAANTYGSVNLILTPGSSVVQPANITVTVTAQDTPAAPQYLYLNVQVRNGFYSLNNVTLSPAYVSAGSPVQLSAQIFNAGNDSNGGGYLGASVQPPNPAPPNFNYNPSSIAGGNISLGSKPLQTINIGALDTTGYAPGVYTITVVFSSSGYGTVDETLTASAQFSVGKPLAATLTATPSVLPPPGGTVLTTLAITRDQLANDVSSLVGAVATSSNSPGNVALKGNNAYVCNPGGVDIINVSNPASPTLVETFGQGDVPAGTTGTGCTVLNNTLIVGASANNGSAPLNLVAYNITSPEAPTRIGAGGTQINRRIAATSFPIFQGNVGITFSDEYTYCPICGGAVTNQFGDLIAIDFTNPSAPVFVGDLFPQDDPTLGGPNFIFNVISPSSGIAYASSTTGTGGNTSGTGMLIVANTSNPAKMSVTTTVNVPNTDILLGAAISGNTMLVAGNTGSFVGDNNPGYTGTMTLTAFDITNPQSPVVKSTVVTQYMNGYGVLTIGNGLFMVSSSSLNGQAVLLIVDATDPTNLVYMQTNQDVATGADIFQNGYIYTTSADGLKILKEQQQAGPTLDIAVQIPTANVVVNSSSFSEQPTSVVPGSGFTTYNFNQPSQNTITWKVAVSNLQPNYPVTIANGATVNYIEPTTGPGTLNVQPLQVEANQIIAITPSVNGASAAKPATYTLTLTNPTSTAVTYTLSQVGVAPSWVSLPASVKVPANGTATANMVVTPSISASDAEFSGSYELTVVAQASAGFSGSVEAGLQINEDFAGTSDTTGSYSERLTANPASVTVGLGSTTTTSVTVTNTGASAEYLQAPFNYNPPPVTLSLDTTNPFQVQPGFSNALTIPLAVTATTSATPGTQTQTLTLNGQTSGNTYTLPISVTVLKQGVTTYLSPTAGTPATQFVFYVTNTGIATDTFNLTASGPLATGITFSPSSITLASGVQGQVTVNLGVLPPLLGTASFTLSATSKANPLATSAAVGTIAIPATSSVTAVFNPASVQVSSLNTANTLLLDVQNTGTLDGLFNVDISKVTGPATATITDPYGNAVQSLTGIPIPALSSTQFVVQGVLTKAGTGTINASTALAGTPTIAATASATLTSQNTTPVYTAPVATTNVAATIPMGRSTILDGSGSHDTNSPLLPLSYAWTFTSVPTGSAVTNSSIRFSTSDRAAFTPDIAGSYIVKLTVSNGHLSANASATLVAEHLPPVAIAGKPFNSKVDLFAILDGKDSYDPNDQKITYAWTVKSVPAGSEVTSASINNITTPRAFFKPDVAGQYTLSLVVSDPNASSTPSSVVVTAIAGNVPPNANAGYNQNAETGRTVTLNGMQSVDPDNAPSPLTYSWTVAQVPSGSTITSTSLTGANTATPTFTPDVAGSYEFKLTVSDGAATGTDTVTVNAYAGFSPPNAVSTPQVDVAPGNAAVVDGSASFDPDNAPDPLQYDWALSEQPAGSTATIQNPTTVTPVYKPDVNGYHVLQLEVTDGLDTNDRNLLILAAEACDADGNGVVNQTDLELIQQAEGQAALPNDPRDPTHAGTITAADYTACQSKTQYQLTIVTAGTGGGTVNPPSGPEPADTPIALTATPNSCSTFAGFSSNVINGAVTLTGPTTVTATFNNASATEVGLLPAGGTPSGQVVVTATANRRVTGSAHWIRSYTLQNTGSALSNMTLALDPPYTNVIAVSSSAGTTACTTPEGSWYITVPNLAAGASASVSVEVTTSVATSPWNSTIRILAGGKP